VEPPRSGDSTMAQLGRVEPPRSGDSTMAQLGRVEPPRSGDSTMAATADRMADTPAADPPYCAGTLNNS
jgi:hypothetical protein